MNSFGKKVVVDSNVGSYNTNSFRGTKLKKPEEKTTKLLESLNPKPMFKFENKDKLEIADAKKVKPKLLTSKLPLAFFIDNMSKNR